MISGTRLSAAAPDQTGESCKGSARTSRSMRRHFWPLLKTKESAISVIDAFPSFFQTVQKAVLY